MKTAISLPDGEFRQADRLARQLKKSRSALYRQALADFVNRHAVENVTEAMNRVVARVDTRPDNFSRAAARKTLERNTW